MTPVRAVLFDLDGTLYHQPPLRVMMAIELGLRPWLQVRPAGVLRLWRMLRIFRTVREELRSSGPDAEPLESLQYSVAAARAGVTEGEMREAVREWIFERPLGYVRAARRRDVRETFAGLRSAGIPIGIFSDYPTRRKLEALGVAGWVSLELCATDDGVNAFKPHPRGFLAACERWGLAPADVLYVGDRADVDAVGAAAAGMQCAILGARESGGFIGVRRLSDVLSVIRVARQPDPLAVRQA